MPPGPFKLRPPLLFPPSPSCGGSWSKRKGGRPSFHSPSQLKSSSRVERGGGRNRQKLPSCRHFGTPAVSSILASPTPKNPAFSSSQSPALTPSPNFKADPRHLQLQRPFQIFFAKFPPPLLFLDRRAFGAHVRSLVLSFVPPLSLSRQEFPLPFTFLGWGGWRREDEANPTSSFSFLPPLFSKSSSATSSSGALTPARHLPPPPFPRPANHAV